MRDNHYLTISNLISSRVCNRGVIYFTIIIRNNSIVSRYDWRVVIIFWRLNYFQLISILWMVYKIDFLRHTNHFMSMNWLISYNWLMNVHILMAHMLRIDIISRSIAYIFWSTKSFLSVKIMHILGSLWIIHLIHLIK